MERGPQMKSSYDDAAREFDTLASKSAWNAYADRPAVLSMLPDLAGLKVLDAGCGSGLYCGPLLERGAVLSAFDASVHMVNLARSKHLQGVDFKVHSMETISEHYGQSSFDLVLSTLVLSHIRDPNSVFAQVFTVLKPGGILLFSVVHPFRAFDEYGQRYFEHEQYDAVFPNVGATIPAFRRPLEDYVRPLLQLGFTLLDFVETKPIEECESAHPRSYERMLSRPTMLIAKWRKPNKTAGGDA